MIFNLQNPYDIPKFNEYVEKLLGSNSVVEIKKKLPRRSLSQNSYLYLILGWFSCEYGCSIDEAKVDFYKRTCNKEIFVRNKKNKRGQEIQYLRSSSELETGEMTLSIERFRNWSSSQAGIYLPAPNEQDFLTFIQQEIERNKSFM